MKEANELLPEASGVMYLVPKVFLETLLEKQNQMMEMLSQITGMNPKDMVGDYVSEEHARIMLGRKNTWFWMMRTKGLLSFTKVGRKTFYNKKELISLLDSNNRPAYRKEPNALRYKARN
jgi:hypothetical protein